MSKIHKDIKERLLDACDGHPYAKIPWPHRLLHDAKDHIEALEEQYLEAAGEVGRLRARISEISEGLRASAYPFDKAAGIANEEAAKRNHTGTTTGSEPAH